MIFLYQTFSILLSPFIDLYLIFRKFKKKEDANRFKERFGYSDTKRPEGFLVWIHAASVGESKSALTLAIKFLENNPKANILITSGTITSAAVVTKNLPSNTIHQYIPIDKFFTVKRFLKHWKPDLAMFVESELWPNLVMQTTCPLILINGRVSDRSFARWKILHNLGFNLLQKFTICFAQSQSDTKKFINLGMKNVHFVGNLKSASAPLKVDEKELEKLKQQIGSRKFWLASSTHAGEEEIIINTHLKLKKYFPDLLTIIAPRHPNRLEDIIKIITKYLDPNLKISVRSFGESIKDCDIYLADTLGELGTFYSLSKISFIAGSIIKGIGGHNPYEALQLGSVILAGEHVENFKEVYQDLKDSGACVIVKNEENLLFNLLKLMKNENYYSSLIKNSQNYKDSNVRVLDNILQIILDRK